MRNDMLTAHTEALQQEYKDVLRKASTGILDDLGATVDQLKAFWYTNRRLVDCILRYACEANQGYIFTGATYVDVANDEHYPFVALGRCHFVDDPILRFWEVIDKGTGGQLEDRVKSLIVKIISDNIEIIEKCSTAITILPIRYLAPIDSKLVHKAAMQAFFSMFQVRMDFQYYQTNFRTAEDIQRGLKPGMEKGFVLSDQDDRSLSLQDRLKLYRQEAPLSFNADASDAAVFWSALYGYFSQAFDITLTCLQYQMIPYVRYSVASYYLLSLSENFVDNADVQEMLFRSAVAHVLYRSFEKTRVEKVTFDDYRKSLLESSFSDHVFEELALAGVTLRSPDVSKTVGIIHRNLDVALTSIRAQKARSVPGSENAGPIA